MSAWIVSKNHIDVLITAALAWELIVQEQADEAGQMLWEECRASVACRYPQDGDGEWPGPWDLDKQRPGPPGLTLADIKAYRFMPVEGTVDPEVVELAARSYRYQSCEHPGWENSKAHRLCVDLIEAAQKLAPGHIRRHGELTGETGAWDAHSPRIFLAAAELREATAPQPY